MSILNIITYPHNNLRQKAEPIKHIDESIKQIANDMLATMYQQNGIGLAGNQVGVLKQIIVIDIQPDEVPAPLVLINPKIVTLSDELVESDEGCLSIPGISATIKRFSQVTVEFQNLENKTQLIEVDGLLGVCLQHEIDHLNGILFIDHLSPLKQEIILKKYKKKQQQK